jgi:hypothetical protein
MTRMHDAVGRADYDATRSRQRGGIRSIAAALVLALALLAVFAPNTSASIHWCRTDPAVSINGQTVNIFVASTEEIYQQATGPTDVVVSVPVGVSAQLLWTDPGFGYGETVTIVESSRLRVTASGVQIMVSAYVPATGSLPVLVEIVPANAGVVTASAQGATNAQVRVRTTV